VPPAGFEPATIGLEAPTLRVLPCNGCYQAVYLSVAIYTCLLLEYICSCPAMPDHPGTSAPGPYPDAVDFYWAMPRRLARSSNKTGRGPAGQPSSCSTTTKLGEPRSFSRPLVPRFQSGLGY
jgi:hypothetical protein